MVTQDAPECSTAKTRTRCNSSDCTQEVADAWLKDILLPTLLTLIIAFKVVLRSCLSLIWFSRNNILIDPITLRGLTHQLTNIASKTRQNYPTSVYNIPEPKISPQRNGSILTNNSCPRTTQATSSNVSSRSIVGKRQQETLDSPRANTLSLTIILVTFGFYILNDATPCHGLGSIEHYHTGGDYVSPIVYQSNPFVTYYNPQSDWSQPTHSFARQLNDVPTSIMSATIGSIALDSSEREPEAFQLQPSQSWTSLLNPFSSNNNNNGQAQSDTLDAHIRKILVPRVSGTQSNIEVRQYIVDTLASKNYHVELDQFDGSTPIGKVRFANIIASSNPMACRQLVLACHYDSKMMRGFLGAVDSAVPCAMLLKIAETFNTSYRPNGSDSTKNDLGLRLIFFDGEEAFVQWSHTDSLYGSRHLAAKWANQAAPDNCHKASGSKKSTELDRIELFVLLDLIGTSDTTFVQYNAAVRRHYESLQKFEKDYILKSKPNLTQQQLRREAAFKSRMLGLDMVEDDHVPFKQRGVPILLLLAHPFPRVWHTLADNYEAIDFARTRRIQHVLESFIANYS